MEKLQRDGSGNTCEKSRPGWPVFLDEILNAVAAVREELFSNRICFADNVVAQQTGSKYSEELSSRLCKSLLTVYALDTTLNNERIEVVRLRAFKVILTDRRNDPGDKVLGECLSILALRTQLCGEICVEALCKGTDFVTHAAHA